MASFDTSQGLLSVVLDFCYYLFTAAAILTTIIVSFRCAPGLQSTAGSKILGEVVPHWLETGNRWINIAAAVFTAVQLLICGFHALAKKGTRVGTTATSEKTQLTSMVDKPSWIRISPSQHCRRSDVVMTDPENSSWDAPTGMPLKRNASAKSLSSQLSSFDLGKDALKKTDDEESSSSRVSRPPKGLGIFDLPSESRVAKANLSSRSRSCW